MGKNRSPRLMQKNDHHSLLQDDIRKGRPGRYNDTIGRPKNARRHVGKCRRSILLLLMNAAGYCGKMTWKPFERCRLSRWTVSLHRMPTFSRPLCIPCAVLPVVADRGDRPKELVRARKSTLSARLNLGNIDKAQRHRPRLSRGPLQGLICQSRDILGHFDGMFISLNDSLFTTHGKSSKERSYRI